MLIFIVFWAVSRRVEIPQIFLTKSDKKWSARLATGLTPSSSHTEYFVTWTSTYCSRIISCNERSICC